MPSPTFSLSDASEIISPPKSFREARTYSEAMRLIERDLIANLDRIEVRRQERLAAERERSPKDAA